MPWVLLPNRKHVVPIVTAFNPVVVGGFSAVCDLWPGMTVLATVLIVTVISYQRLYNPNKFCCYAPAEAAPGGGPRPTAGEKSPYAPTGVRR
jgi:hypothetical protein